MAKSIQNGNNMRNFAAEYKLPIIYMNRILSTVVLAVIALSMTAQTQAPAFPGAEGHGRYVTGGREGKIVHVTNLNDSGDGSFRKAVSGSDKKIVVFDVGGVIALKSDVSIGANTTILGQTAPAPGITLRYYTLGYNGNNIVVRFIRSRRGQEKNINDGADATWTRNRTGIILDHCSFSWSIDEVASFYDNNNFTMQWCTIGESLNNAGHGKGAHGYGGIWGGKLASFHHNLICHVNNRSPRFNGARYNWTGYTGNKLYSEYKWQNAVQAENVDYRNCVVYNADGCYGGPGGGKINMVGNYLKSGPAATIKKLTQCTVGANGNSEGYPIYWGMTSRYYVEGNMIDGANAGWEKFTFDDGTITHDGKRYSKDPNHYNGDNEEYLTSNGTDYICMQLDAPTATGEITTHSATNAYEKVLTYAGASLDMDEVDARYFQEARTNQVQFSGSVTNKKGRIDLVSDVNGYTEANFGSGSREVDFDTDHDGIPNVWETANGLDPNNPTDAVAKSLDPAGFYMNIEIYANSLVQHIMLAGNEDAEDAAKEYYPAYKQEDGTIVEAINTLGVDLGGGGSSDDPDVESKTITVAFNGSDIESEAGYFTYGDGKHNFNTKFTGKYNGLEFSQGLKMEGTTLIKFTTAAKATVIIVQSTWSDHTLKFDNTELPLSTASTPNDSEGVRVYTLSNVAAGNHQITRGSGESGIFYVEIHEGNTTAIHQASAVTRQPSATYNLAGQRVDASYKGIVIRNGMRLIQR